MCTSDFELTGAPQLLIVPLETASECRARPLLSLSKVYVQGETADVQHYAEK